MSKAQVRGWGDGKMKLSKLGDLFKKRTHRIFAACFIATTIVVLISVNFFKAHSDIAVWSIIFILIVQYFLSLSFPKYFWI